jgi:hypothetical protein
MLRRLIAPALALALWPTGPLAAQGAITPGRVAQGTISGTDSLMGDGSRFDEWRFAGKARRRYRIVLRSRDFDAFLAVGKGRGSAWDQAMTDDDSGGDTDASLLFVASADGEYVIRANTLSEGQTGAYTLSLTDEGEVQPIRAQAIQPGQAVSGRLDSKDAVTTEGKPVDYYKFTTKLNHRYAVTLLSTEFDAMLELGAGGSGVWTKQRENDDGAGGTNARLEWVAREGGEVWIAARALASDSGRYTLTLEDLGEAPPRAAPVILAKGRAVEGRLEAGDDESDDGVFDVYYIEGRADDVIVIRMDSDGFDPVVAIGRGEGDDWSELDKDDDGGLGTNAHLEFRIPETGKYVIRAKAIGQNGTGAYTIRLE